MIHSVSKLIHRERTYADDSAIYMHNHALSSIETHLLIPTFRKIRYTFDNPGHCFIFLCLSNSWQMNCVAYLLSRVLSVCRPIIQFSHTLEQVPDFRIFTVCSTSWSFAFPPRRCYCDATLFVNDVLHTTPFSWLTIAFFCTYFPEFLTRPAHFNQFKQVIFTKNRTKDFTLLFKI